MLRINELKLPINHTLEELEEKISKKLNTKSNYSYSIFRRSVDARKKPDLFFSYIIDIASPDEKAIMRRASKDVVLVEKTEYVFPYQTKSIDEEKRPIVVGMGPAGLFAALYLARAGFRPIVIERGDSIENRSKTVSAFWENGVLDPDSNVQFGEGGAGAFSDGKLNTQVKDKSGRNRAVLKDFVKYGAPDEILYDYMPHVGTDKLVNVVKNISEEIRNLGGKIYYNSLVDSFYVSKKGNLGIKVSSKGLDYCDRPIILALGHSARDSFKALYELGVNMEAKAFAVGLRVQHPVEVINKAQYGVDNSPILGNASYKLTYTCKDQRGVYSFCMCPGGYVVNASSEIGYTAVNGMSYYDRSASKSNSAIIVTITPEDYSNDSHPLSGVRFQRELEKKAYEIGKGYVPVETYGEFRSCKRNESVDIKSLKPCIKGQWQHAAVHEILPEYLRNDLCEGMESFGSKISGFNDTNVILAGVESRTSSPVRIVRNENGEGSVCGLYPVGEGAGYAGGITSAAMDGILAAQNVAKTILG